MRNVGPIFSGHLNVATQFADKTTTTQAVSHRASRPPNKCWRRGCAALNDCALNPSLEYIVFVQSSNRVTSMADERDRARGLSGVRQSLYLRDKNLFLCLTRQAYSVQHLCVEWIRRSRSTTGRLEHLGIFIGNGLLEFSERNKHGYSKRCINQDPQAIPPQNPYAAHSGSLTKPIEQLPTYLCSIVNKKVELEYMVEKQPSPDLAGTKFWLKSTKISYATLVRLQKVLSIQPFGIGGLRGCIHGAQAGCWRGVLQFPQSVLFSEPPSSLAVSFR